MTFQTVISLRTKLGATEDELRRLKESVGDFSGESYANLVEKLSIENHVLRRKIMSNVQETSNENADMEQVKQE